MKEQGDTLGELSLKAHLPSGVKEIIRVQSVSTVKIIEYQGVVPTGRGGVYSG